MPLKKSATNDPFAAIRLEAQELGITLDKAGDGTYTASLSGGPTLESYNDPRALLDDMTAIAEMEEKSDIYDYTDDDLGGAIVTVGDQRFTADSFAAAFAKAKESLMPKAAPAKARSLREQPGATQASGMEGEILTPSKPPKAPEKVMADAFDRANGAPPNGLGAPDVGTLANVLAEALLEQARILTDAATRLRSGETLAPFTGDFGEDNPPPPPAKPRSHKAKA